MPEPAETFLDLPFDDVLGSFDRPFIDTASAFPTTSDPELLEVPIGLIDWSAAPPPFVLITNFSWNVSEAWVELQPEELLGSMDIPLAGPVAAVNWMSAVVEELPPTLLVDELLGSFDSSFADSTGVVQWVPGPADVLPPELAAEQQEAWFAANPIPAIGTYNRYGAWNLYTASLNVGMTYAFEVHMLATAGTVNGRMWDRTASAAVAGSELSTTSASLVRLRSGGLTLIDAHEYEAQFALSAGSTGDVLRATPVPV